MGYARTIWITIGASGRLDWADGELVVPNDFAGKLDGYPEGTVVEVHGAYSRVDARTRRLEIRRLKVADTPQARGLELWRRVSYGDEPRARPEWAAFLETLHALRNDSSPTALMLRAWHAWVEGNNDDAMEMFGEALTLDTFGAEQLVRALWNLAPRDARSTLSTRQREEVVRAVWRSIGGWDWVHPCVSSLWTFPRYPPHFGGPCPDVNEAVLRAWLARRALEIATPEEAKQITQIQKLPEAKRRELVQRLRAEDERKHDYAYSDMRSRWSSNPDNDMDSPPDHVEVTWTEESRLLPARWAGLMSDSSDWDDTLSAASRWLLGFWRTRRGDADAFAYRVDAACIVSALQPELVDCIERVVFAHAGLCEGYALLLLDDGRGCLLDAPDGAFGAWSIRVDDVETIVASLPDAELAHVATKRGQLTWSTRSYCIPTPAQEAAAREGKPLPPRARKPKVEPSKPRWVVHKRHGRGLVVGSIPGPKGPKLVIEFETAGRKTLLHTFVDDA